MRDIHANLACVRSNTNFRKTKMLKPKQLHLALVPLMLNPNRPSRFDLHRHFLGICRSSLPFIKQLIWVHMDQAAFGVLSRIRHTTAPQGGFPLLSHQWTKKNPQQHETRHGSTPKIGHRRAQGARPVLGRPSRRPLCSNKQQQTAKEAAGVVLCQESPGDARARFFGFRNSREPKRMLI
jgi:hypothetical protein